MTQQKFNTTIAKLLHDFEKRVKRCTKPELERLLRADLRDTHGLVFVKEYTVKAHFRPAKPKIKRAVAFTSRSSNLTH